MSCWFGGPTTGPALNQISDLQLAPHLTALRCLFLLAKHHGVHVPLDLLSRADPRDSATAVLGVMREVGLTGQLLKQCSWRDVGRLGNAYPAMAERTDGTWLIVAGPVPSADGAGALAVLDPMAEHAGMVVIPRAEFKALWTGRLLLTKRTPRSVDEDGKIRTSLVPARDPAQRPISARCCAGGDDVEPHRSSRHLCCSTS